ncbi:MAG: hypothetical protein LQ338_002582 [Usnochroma carphineum]|nr:MAG: hypothetical protein LQ338_002582 [Usnochroma carphineum]
MPPLYDTFLIQEPLRQDPFAVTHNPHDTATLIDIYRKSILYFEERRRRRAVERLQYELGALHMQQGEWKKALKVLEPLWSNVSWRQEAWWGFLAGLGERLRECAWRCGDAETVVKGCWEGISECLETTLEHGYDFSTCLNGMPNLELRPMVVVRADEVVSCLSCTFAFGATQGNVGEPLPAQVVIASHARKSTAPIILSHFLISFDGGLEDIKIGHEAEEELAVPPMGNVRLAEITLRTETGTPEASSPVTLPHQGRLGGVCDLTFSPGSTKILSFLLITRYPGTVRVASMKASVEPGGFDFQYIVSEANEMRQEDYWVQTTEGFSPRPAGNNGMNEIRILPKPPKVRIKIPGLRKEYLTDETVTLAIEITNEEDGDAEVTVEARFLGQADAVPTLAWTADAQISDSPEDPLSNQEKKAIPIRHSLGHIEQSETRKINSMFTAKSLPTETVLEIKAVYHLLTEPETPISKVLVNEVVFDRPFEANYDFQPSIDPLPMPNYFQITEAKDPDNVALGLRQIWTSTVRLASFAAEPLIIQDTTLKLNEVQDAAICKISKTSSHPDTETTIAPNDFHESRFEITTQKLDLDDRISTAFLFQLEVRWRRDRPGAPSASTILAVPDLVIPFGEPRVLASVKPSAQGDEAWEAGSVVIPLEYTIENPSTHVLNFDISMETSDEFVFSGPKTTSLQLVPVSRHTLEYRIVPLVRGKWITPGLRVLDTHFNQVLRVQGTGGGVRSDRKGANVWVDAEE